MGMPVLCSWIKFFCGTHVPYRCSRFLGTFKKGLCESFLPTQVTCLVTACPVYSEKQQTNTNNKPTTVNEIKTENICHVYYGIMNAIL